MFWLVSYKLRRFSTNSHRYVYHWIYNYSSDLRIGEIMEELGKIKAEKETTYHFIENESITRE